MFFGRGDAVVASRNAPLDEKLITQQGATFTWQATAFDTRARPTAVSQFSSLGHSRTESTSYFDQTRLWVLGQVASRGVRTEGAVLGAGASLPLQHRGAEGLQRVDRRRHWFSPARPDPPDVDGRAFTIVRRWHIEMRISSVVGTRAHK